MKKCVLPIPLMMALTFSVFVAAPSLATGGAVMKQTLVILLGDSPSESGVHGNGNDYAHLFFGGNREAGWDSDLICSQTIQPENLCTLLPRMRTADENPQCCWPQAVNRHSPGAPLFQIIVDSTILLQYQFRVPITMAWISYCVD